MKFHGVQIQEGSVIANASIASGASFPSDPDEGELFYRSDSDLSIKGMYCYLNGDWARLSTDADGLFVLKSGDTMTGTLNLPSNGLNVGVGQLVVAGGNVSSTGTVTASNFIGTASKATLLETGRNIVISGAVTGSTTFDGSQNVNIISSLANQTDSGTGSFLKVTVNGKGLVTGTTAVTSSDITGALGTGFVQKTGDTMTGTLNLPVNGLQVGTSQLITSGSLLGLAGSTAANSAVSIANTNPLSTTTQIGQLTSLTATSAATVAVVGVSSATSTSAATFTAPYVSNFNSAPIIKGAGSTITNTVGILAPTQTAGTNNATLADTTNFTGSWFINQQSNVASFIGGSITLAGNLTMSNLSANCVMYTGGSKALTSSGSFTYDGNGLNTSKPTGLGASSYVSSAALTVGTSGPLASTSQTGVNSALAITATATVAAIGVNSVPATAASAFTVPYVAGYASQAIIKGAGSTITRAIGLYALDQTVGTNNATIADNLAFTGNYFINQSGTNQSLLSGALGIGASATGFITGASGLLVSHAGAASAPVVIGDTSTPANLTGLYLRSTTESRVSIGAGAFLSLYTGGPTGTERVRLDNNGNVGQGVTPSAWESGAKVIQLSSAGAGGTSGTTGSLWARGDSIRLIENLFYTGSQYTYAGSTGGAAFTVSNGSFQWQSAPAGTAGNAATLTSSMALDANGILGLNVIPDAWGTMKAMQFGSYLAHYDSGTTNVGTAYNSYFNGANWIARFTAKAGLNEFSPSTGNHQWYSSVGTPTAGTAITFTQSMTLDGSGNLLVGYTDTSQIATNVGGNVITGAGAANIYTGHTSGTSTGSSYTSYYYNGGLIGGVTQNGTTGVLYNVSSDQRLKENIVPAVSQSTAIDAIQVRSFNFKTDPTHVQLGFIAQELFEVVPDAVKVGGDDAQTDAWGVDFSKLVPLLVKEVQELRARVAVLEAK
jgi:hypothetical protein